jgi:hypothetical protein
MSLRTLPMTLRAGAVILLLAGSASADIYTGPGTTPIPLSYPSPVRELADSAVGGAGFTEIPVSSTNFKTAAVIDLKTGPNGSKTSVERGLNSTSAVYAGVSLPNALAVQPSPVEFSEPGSGSIFNFKYSGDSAQGWATMTSTGMPYVLTRVFGDASAAGTASWIARLAVPAQATNMYVRFTLPEIQIKGTTEFDGPSKWQSRFRAELMLNGHPVWNSEALRFNELTTNPGSCPNISGDKAKYFSTFGTAPSGLSSTDLNDWSTLNAVTLALGNFPAGATLELTLVVRADTQVFHSCCKDSSTGELFCTGATAALKWNTTVATPVRFWAGPAI